jgi:hypothetical protein
MCQPEKFVVLNKPVERALRALGYEVDPRRSITGRGYRQFLEELTDFIRASDAAGLKAAPALDAFFYAYNRGLPRD